MLSTERLILRRPDPEVDLAEAFAIFSDVAGWHHAPSGRHSDPAVTRGWLERAAGRWDTDGLSYWVARLRDSGAVAGVGGVQRQSTGAWNIAYRLATPQWGRGLATELAQAGMEQANAADASVPRIAWILKHNRASHRVAERLGLTECGLRVDPSDEQVRLAYADRPLADRHGVAVDITTEFPSKS